MGYLVLPVLILILAPPPGARERVLADFSRFSKAVNQEVTIVEIDGAVRQGILTEATDDQVTVRFGSGTRSFSRANIASAERRHDGRIDGVIKGVLWGTLAGVVTSNADGRGHHTAGTWAAWLTGYAGVGYLLDAAESNPQTIYQSPGASGGRAAAPKPSMSLSFRF